MISHTTKDFWECFNYLPQDIQKQAEKAYKIWNNNPFYPSLYFRQIHQIEPIFSVRITLGFRALGLKEKDTITWFWIGSHAEYNRLIAKF